MAAVPALPGIVGDRSVHSDILSERLLLLSVHPDNILRMGQVQTFGVHPDGDIVRSRYRSGGGVDIFVFWTVLTPIGSIVR